ncbi:MAG: deoxyribodipyrimidine photo-lyase [Rickettsiaceae bacterium]|nr:deoxyribodipyrimidine photo-lyase [Rickettsiaceae bacterium]
MKTALIWLRRSLRLKSNMVISKALEQCDKIKICFLFDEKILSYFPDRADRRLSFIANHIEMMNRELAQFGSSVEVLYGNPNEQIPKFAKENNINVVFCDMDFEPSSIIRDNEVEKILREVKIDFIPVLDHLLIHPSELLKQDGTPFKVFTPYMKLFRSRAGDQTLRVPSYDLHGRTTPSECIFSNKEMLKRAGYEYIEDPIWHPKKADESFRKFVRSKLPFYHLRRNLLSGDHTSSISPYLRFGALSIREVFSISLENEVAESYVNELIWREFYAYILFHFPYSASSEFQEKYKGKITWRHDPVLFEAFCAGLTGYPVVDAAIRQLLQTGWMHNRARMIVASFFTKNLFMDWREGEKFFARYLMDYDLASNAGGWQWTASTGTDAQPYFRVFNPINQGKDHDPDGEYVKKYVPELSGVKISDIHDPETIMEKYYVKNYPRPIVDYKKTRENAIKAFQEVV